MLDVLVTNSRDTKAAKRFFLKLLKGTESVPCVVVTDKLRSYGAAHRQATPSVEHHSSKYLNSRAENSHLPTRQREYAMQGFRSVVSTQRFLASFSRISPHFRPRRRLPHRNDRPPRHLAPDHRYHPHDHGRLTQRPPAPPARLNPPASTAT